jgi:hypothetical protein
MSLVTWHILTCEWFCRCVVPVSNIRARVLVARFKYDDTLDSGGSPLPVASCLVTLMVRDFGRVTYLTSDSDLTWRLRVGVSLSLRVSGVGSGLLSGIIIIMIQVATVIRATVPLCTS